MLPSILPLATYFTNLVQISVIVLALDAISKEGQANVKKEEESDKIKTSEDSDSLRKHVQNLLKEPSSGVETDNVEDNSNATQQTEKLACMDPALLYFYDKFFPGDVDKAIVNKMVSGIIQKAKTVEKKRPIVPLRRNLRTDAPNQTKASDRADKNSPSTKDNEGEEIKKALLLSRLESILLDANVLLKTQAESKNWTPSSHEVPSKDDERSKQSSNPASSDDTAQTGTQHKAQSTSTPGLRQTEAVGEKVFPKTEPPSNNNPKSPPAAEVKKSDSPSHSKPILVEKKGEEVEEIDVSGALAKKRADKNRSTQVQNEREKPIPKTEAGPHIPTEQPVKQEPKEDKVASRLGSAPAPAKLVNVGSSLPKEKTQEGTRKENKARPIPKQESTNAAKAKDMSPATEPERKNSNPKPSAATEEEKGSGRPIRSKITVVEEKIKREEVEEVYVSSAHARERADKSRLKQAQIERGRVVPKPDAVTHIPVQPSVKQEPKKEDKVGSGQSPALASAQPAKASSSSLKEDKYSAKYAQTGVKASAPQYASSSTKPDAVPHIPVQPSVKQEPKKGDKVVSGQSPALASAQPAKASSSSLKEDKYSAKYAQTGVKASAPQYASSSKASAGIPAEAKRSTDPINPKSDRYSIPPVTSKPEPKVQPPPRSIPTPRSPKTSDGYGHDSYMVAGGTFQCSGTTNQHRRCLNRVRSSASYIRGNEPKVFCYWHGVSHGSTVPKSLDPSAKEPGRCSAITLKGTLCKRNASHFQPKAQYGYCWQHA